ncbi:nitronate monooxygenase [Paenibacillus pabuli]|uniref:nitronate monooxygenase n=1 Tax=Paenibacillus pabuli TaxID=1472 RepID=UPI001FFF5BE1|nr:nitronate monooxygenase [Paenibacillus pabuli]UPK41136.1 nitronate monooxygenase [Paenibacillus pabuli]
MAIAKILVDAVNIPVIAAGGIVDRGTANGAMAVGAEGVFVGCRGTRTWSH